MIDPGSCLASREDTDISEALASMMTAEGIDLHLGHAVDAAKGAKDGVQLLLADGTKLRGSHVLVATGRVPNTDALGLETVEGIETDEHGHISTNGQLETGAAGIWALGDINGRGAFTHTSYHDHDIVAESILSEPKNPRRSADHRHSIYAMFTDPPLGHVGLYEAEARERVAKGRRVSQAVIRMEEVSRAKEESETQGLMKLLIDEDSGEFLGASILGLGADEIIQVIGQAMAAGAHWQTVRNALPVHPTVTEFLPTLIDKRRRLSSS